MIIKLQIRPIIILFFDKFPKSVYYYLLVYIILYFLLLYQARIRQFNPIKV